MVKLTLSMTPETVRLARKLSKQNGRSISAMVSGLIHSMAIHDSIESERIPPITKSLAGIVKLPEGKTYREVIEEALEEKYR